MAFVPHLRECMIKAGYKTYRSLAKATGLTPQTISRACKTGEVRQSTAIILQDAIGMEYPIGDNIYADDFYGIQKQFKAAESIGNSYYVLEKDYVYQAAINDPEGRVLVEYTLSKQRTTALKDITDVVNRLNKEITNG